MDLASLEPVLPPQRDPTLADLGRTVWDLVTTPYRAPDENRIAGGQPPRLGFVDHFVGQTAKSLFTLPQRAFEASRQHVLTGEYDPAPILEAAMLPMGGAVRSARSGGSRWREAPSACVADG
jgi:hypothetical protein